MDNGLQKHDAGNAAMVCDVFGSLALWPSGWGDNDVAQGEYPDRGDEVRHFEQRSQDTVRLREYADLSPLAEYHSSNRRLSAPRTTIPVIRIRGEPGEILEGGRIVLLLEYSEKEIDGAPLGRRCARELPTHCINREERAASRPKDTYEFDISNFPLSVCLSCFAR